MQGAEVGKNDLFEKNCRFYFRNSEMEAAGNS